MFWTAAFCEPSVWEFTRGALSLRVAVSRVGSLCVVVSLVGGDCPVAVVGEGGVVGMWCGLLVARVCCVLGLRPATALSGGAVGSGAVGSCLTVVGVGATRLVACGGGVDDSGVFPWAAGVDPPGACGAGGCAVGG